MTRPDVAAVERALRAATEAHTDLNTFGAVVSILEGGHIYSAKSHAAAERIIRICKAEQQKRLREHDRAREMARDRAGGAG